MLYYYFRKIIGTLAMPTSVTLLLLIITCLLFIFTNYHTAAKIILVITIIFTLTISLPFFPCHYLRQLQYRYPALINVPPDIKYIVVLGGGFYNQPKLPANSHLSPASLARLVEGLRLYREHPQATLVLSGAGYGKHSQATMAAAYANTAREFGVPADKIIIEQRPHDTRQEANYISKIVKQQPFILVTSAFHMQRAMNLFEAQHTHPIPAPCGYMNDVINSRNPLRFLPSINNVFKSTVVVHEYLGSLWNKWQR